MRNIKTYRNRVLFTKIKPNIFLVIKKDSSIFQNIQDYLMDSYYLNEGCYATRQVENGFVPQINSRLMV